MKEIWKPIPGYRGLYDVSNMERVRRSSSNGRHKKGAILRGGLRKEYREYTSHKNKKQKLCAAHRLVLFAFVGVCPKGMQGSHLNDIKTDNRLENLQ